MRLLLVIPLAASTACLIENPAFDGPVGTTVTTGTIGTIGTSDATGPSTSPTEPAGTGSTDAGTDSTGGISSEGTSTSGGTEAISGTSTGDGTTGTSTGAPDTDTSTGEDSTGQDSTGGPIELPPEATLCGKPGPWVWSEPQALGMPVNVAEGDLDMWLGSQDLLLLWSSYRGGVQDTYRATRSAVGMPFAWTFANNKDIGLGTDGEDGKIALSGGGARGYLSARMPMDANFRIYVGDRKNGNYAPLTPLPLAFPGYPEALDPHISEDDLRLYYAPAGADQRIVVATRPAMNQPFGAPSVDPFVNIDDPTRHEADPTLPAHELVLIYTRTGTIGTGGHELWFAARASVGDPFGPSQPLPGVNSPAHDTSAHISGSGCELFFARSTVQDEMAWDIYRSEIQ